MKYSYVSRSVSPIAIFSLALAIRLTYNLTVARDYYPLHDSLTYQSIAYNILQYHCYCLLPHLPTVDRAPLWPALIALIYGMFGPHDHFVRLFLCLIGSGTCLLTYALARGLFGRASGVAAGVIAALYPFLYIYDGWLYTESLYTFLLLAFVYTMYLLQHKTASSRMLVLGGLLLALITLTRPNGLLILGLFVLWSLLVARSGILPAYRVRRYGVVIPLVTALLVIPWTARNYLVTGELVPVAVGDGKVLLGAYNDMILRLPYYLGIWIIPRLSAPDVDRQFPADCASACEVRRDRTYLHYAQQWMQNHQSTLPYLLLLHFLNTWQTTTQEADLPINRFAQRPAAQLVVSMMKEMTPIVLVLATLGLILTRKKWRSLLFIYGLIALTVAQNIVFYGIPRFRAPIEPLLIILASGIIWWTLVAIREFLMIHEPVT